MKIRHTIAWVDIPVNDLDRAISFYAEVLNEPVRKIAEYGLEFGLLPHTEDNVSGCLCVLKDRNPSCDGPLIYLNVEGRLDEAIEIARSLGQKIMVEKEQVGPYGHRAVLIDTEGNGIALYSKEG